MNPTIPLVTLAVSRGPEIYRGEPTGQTAYRAESIDCPQTGSVLGRGNTPQGAITDWKRRARDDGHRIEVYSYASRKPARCLTLAEFIPMTEGGESFYNLCRFSDLVGFSFGYAGGALFASQLIEENGAILTFDACGNLTGTTDRAALVANVTRAIRQANAENKAETRALDRETQAQFAAQERAANRGGAADFDT
jgi:hypothetical protein